VEHGEMQPTSAAIGSHSPSAIDQNPLTPSSPQGMEANDGVT